jgi:hypothetical protein
MLSSSHAGSRAEESSADEESAYRPVVARLAGLPASAIDPLSSPRLNGLSEIQLGLERDLGSARSEFVERVEDRLTEFSAEARRVLLRAKRDAFNGRPLGRYRDGDDWSQLLAVDADLPDRIVGLERQAKGNASLLAQAYEEEVTRERRHVLDLAGDTAFLRGIAIARPGLVRKIRARARVLRSGDFTKSPAKWEQSLLRFVTRAAAKLSAKSTLTSYALGVIARTDSGPLEVDDSPRLARSLVRLDRTPLEQLQDLLFRLPAVRLHARVAWNETLEEVATNRHRFTRGGRWEPADGGLAFSAPVRITLDLSTEQAGWLRDTLASEPLHYGEVATRLEAWSTAAPTPIPPAPLDRLVGTGALTLLPPWPTHEPHLEASIRDLLATVARDEPALRPIARGFDDLVRLERSYPSATAPEDAIDEIQATWKRLFRLVLPPDPDDPAVSRALIFEDVTLASADEDERPGPVLRLAPRTARDLLVAAGSLHRFAEVFNPRHDLLHTLAEWWRRQAADRSRMPFRELARGFAPLWSSYRSFDESHLPTTTETFDPLEIAGCRSLREARKGLLADYPALRVTVDGHDHLEPGAVDELLSALPARYAPLVNGAGIFVQPADAEGRSWVLNSLTPGTGSYYTRVTQVLDEPSRAPLLERFVENSTVLVDGEPADLLEVKYPWRSLVRAFPPQTHKVLETQGVFLGLPAERRVRLEDLTVEADLATEQFRLVGPDGRRLLPVELSTWPAQQLPNLLRILLIFGLGEYRGVFPRTATEGDEGFRRYHRLSCGPLVLRRAGWDLDISELRNRLLERSGLEAYAAVQSWRHRFGLPRVAFYYETTHHGRVKPQYVDFTSPSLCDLFAVSLRRKQSRLLHLAEALPAPEDFPTGDPGRNRGVELLIDSMALPRSQDDLALG